MQSDDLGLVERIREAARDIRNDGTPSQVGLTDEECETVAAAIERLVAERDEARKDTERLDFLDRCNATLNAHYGTTYRWELILNGNVNRLMLGHMVVDLNDQKAGGLASCRDAIDGPLAKSRARQALGDT